jgi:hypothetical protein
MGDAENDRAIKDGGNYYVYNTASGKLTYVDSFGGSTSYNTGAQETPKRMEDIPPANVDTAQDGNYMVNNNAASSSEFNWDAVQNNLSNAQKRAGINPLDGKSVIH